MEDATAAVEWLARRIRWELTLDALRARASCHAVSGSAGDECRDARHHHHEAEHDVDERPRDGRLREVAGLLP